MSISPVHHGGNAKASRWLGAGRCSVVQRHGRSVAVGAAGADGAGRGLEWREAEWGAVYQEMGLIAGVDRGSRRLKCFASNAGLSASSAPLPLLLLPILPSAVLRESTLLGCRAGSR